MSRIFSAGALAGLVAVGIGFGSSAVAANDCKLAKGDSPVAEACKAGGVDAAKKEMKRLLRLGRKAGVKFECDNCHSDSDKYEVLTDDAKNNFQKLLAAVEGQSKPAK